MTHAILKKLKPLAAALAVAALLLAPVRPAQAWDKACVYQEPGEGRRGASFPAHMVVVHSFEPGPGGEIPTRIHAGLYQGDNWAAREFHRRNPDAWKQWNHDDPLARQMGLVLPSIMDKIHNSDEVRDAFDESLPPAEGVAKSALAGGRMGCVRIGHLRSGTPFYVMVVVHDRSGRDHVVCGSHSSNPNWWYAQRSGHSRIIWNLRGSVSEPSCQYLNED